MLGFVRKAVALRALAALVAVALSGAPRLAAALRDAGEHVCQCRAHGDGHRCACAICAARARAARRGDVDALPPCHRELALAELADDEARERLAATLPCLRPTCGTEAASAGAPGGETYVLPRPPAVAPPRGAEGIPATAGRRAEHPATPDVPPPKRP